MYVRYSVYLSKNQLEKIRAAAKKGEGVNVRIDPTIRGNSELYLTERQIKKLKTGKAHDLTLSKTQLKKNGGFIFSIPAIIAGISAVAGIASSAANIARAVNQKKHEKLVEEQNREFLKKMGKGVFIPGKKKLAY